MSTITPASAFGVSNYSGTFIPALWSSKLNAKFYKATIFGEIANTNWEGEIKGMGDKIIINQIPDLAISTYTAGGTLTYAVPAPSTIEMNIDKGKYFAFQVNDIMAYQSQPKLMDIFSNDASMQMKIAIDSDVLFNTFKGAHANNQGATAGISSSSYNLGTDAVPVTLTASNILTTLTALAGVLDEQNIPETDRFLVIDPATRQMLMQSNLAQAQFMGDATSMVRNGRIGTIDRFTVYVSNNLPKGPAGTATTGNWQSGDGLFTGATGITVVGTGVKRRAIIAGHKSAISFASQMTKVETIRNPTDFGDYARGLNVYGYKVTKPEALAYAVVA
jgi:hypothetical protein